MAKILSGIEVSNALEEKNRAKVLICKESEINPKLCVIRIGENRGNRLYEHILEKACKNIGIIFESIVLPEQIRQDQLLSRIKKLNMDDSVHGISLLRPFPKHLDRKVVLNALEVSKDVDGMTDRSLAAVYSGKEEGYCSCYGQACIELMDYYGIDCTGKKIAVIGRSILVGKTVAMLLMKKNATVTVCHTGTIDMPSISKEADMLICCAGFAGLVDKEYVKEGQIVIDAGINASKNGENRICGDCSYEEVASVVEAITPVPGGVLNITKSVLLEHVIDAAMKKRKN